MKLVDSLRSALQSLVVNKLRSALTMLGVIIGVASVIAMVAVGNGASQQIQSQVLSLGSNLITVTPGAQTAAGGLRGAGDASQTLTLADLAAIRQQLGPTISAIEAEQQAGRWQVTAGAANWSSTVTGVSADYQAVREWNLAEGDFFTETDTTLSSQVAVIGSTTAANLFNGGSAVGQTIQLRQAFTSGATGNSTSRILAFKVIGVLESKGAASGAGNRDDQILVPLSTAQRVLTGKAAAIGSIVVKAASSDAMADTTQEITDILLARHKIADPASADFTVQNQNDTLAALSSVTQTFTLLLGAIGGISLLVGGIGIMNIMLVSVNERTREIGIRKAVGARKNDILTQFLVEAIALTGLGGLIGTALGWGIAHAAEIVQPTLITVVTTGTVVIAVGVSIAIGLVFGIYPAMRAASLHPIQALRFE